MEVLGLMAGQWTLFYRENGLLTTTEHLELVLV